MTMPNHVHPDDDRLAAFAGAEPDASADAALRMHIASCDRCGPLVEELGLLRDALARLPDVAPSRPLRLVPPVAEPAASRPGALVWLRRLAGPAMAAGAGLVLVGAVGASGLVGGLALSDASGRSVQEASASDGVAVPAAGGGDRSPAPGKAADSAEYVKHSGEPRDQTGSAASAAPPSSAAPASSAVSSPAPASSAAEGTFGPASPSSSEPWLTLLIAGVALFGISAALFFSVSPRAG